MNGPPKRILVVEDDADMLDTFLLVLESEGHDVTGAIHGREALEQLAAGPRPDLILLDLMMPVMTGWEVNEALEADPELAGIPVIFASAGGDPPEVTPGRRTAHLRKPIQLATLLETLRRLGA